jgi:hypothetical protein
VRIGSTTYASVTVGIKQFGQPKRAYPWRVAFVIGSLVLILFLVAVLVVVGHFYGGSDADLLDWHPTRSPAVEAQNEIDDVRQMVEAQNEMRARRGVPLLDEDELRREVAAEEIESLEWPER